jgi:hypothetical protein
MTCSTCSGASLPMRDRTARRRPRSVLSSIALAGVFALTSVIPNAALASAPPDGAAQAGSGITAFAPPRETCDPGETRGAGGFSDVCDAPSVASGGGFDAAGLLPIVGIAVVGGALMLIAAFVVLRRTSAPLVPADPGEWWTCRTCGKTNVVGSARCYGCGTFQR